MRDDPQRIGEVLGELGTTFGIASPADVAKVWAEWPGIVGPGIASHAAPTSLREGVLRVRADSPVWATELGYLGGEIKDRVNRAVGSDLVREVKVWIGPRKTAEPGHREAPEPTPPPADRPAPEDPEEALERARRAWAKRVSRRPSGPSARDRENQEKPR